MFYETDDDVIYTTVFTSSIAAWETSVLP